MLRKPNVLCPVDFSEPSRGALRYAGAIAAHFGATLTIITVNDPLLVEAAALGTSPGQLAAETLRELERFVTRTFAGRTGPELDLEFEVLSGKPAAEALRLARERHCDLVVMSSNGLTGVRKMFFGSTTERLLRETGIPVLVTPAADQGPAHLHEVQGLVRRVLVPVDLTGATAHQVRIARGIAEALSVPLLILNVVEPVRAMLPTRVHVPSIDSERRDRAEQMLAELVAAQPASTRAEALVVFGEPAEEIAKVAQHRNAGLIVMGLHSTELLGPRMGSVTYRVLCLAPKLVLAIPPAHETNAWNAPQRVSADASS